MREETIGISKAFDFGVSSLALIVLKEAREKLGLEAGEKFYLKVDELGRIIYEPLIPRTMTAEGVHAKKASGRGLTRP